MNRTIRFHRPSGSGETSCILGWSLHNKKQPGSTGKIYDICVRTVLWVAPLDKGCGSGLRSIQVELQISSEAMEGLLKFLNSCDHFH